MKLPQFLIAVQLVAAGGCVSVSPGSPDQASATMPQPAPAADRDRREPTDAEVMHGVFAGELLGAEGDLEAAASEYLAAAMESQDPQIAQRATRVALAAQAWQHAAMAASRWVVLQPDSLDARQAAIRTLLVVGDYSGAEYQMNGLLEMMQHDPGRAWPVIASLLTSAHHPGKAQSILDRLVEERGAGGNADAMFARSQLAARNGDLTRARDLAEAAVTLGPDRAELLAWAGRLAVNLDDEETALRHYQAAWSLNPRDTPVAMAYAELLRRGGAVNRAQEILAALPDKPGTRFARVAFALDSGLPDLADEIYAGFETAGYTDGLDRAFQAGQAAELLGRTDAAIRWYKQVEAGDRALVAALRRAFLLAGRGDLEQARNLLAQIRLQRDEVVMLESFLAESQILQQAGQAGEAFELLSGALAMMAGDGQLLYARALVAVQLDRLEDAEADLVQILEQEPQNAAALNALGYTLADRTDRYEEAEKLIRAAYALEPEEASIIDSMGWISYRLGRTEEAERYLREAWERDRNAEIAAHLGEVLWVRGRRDEAREAWRGGLERDPDNPVLAETMRRFGAGR